MSAGRQWIKEIYVGFLLLALSFLYLSHLNSELQRMELQEEVSKMKRASLPVAKLKVERNIGSDTRQVL